MEDNQSKEDLEFFETQSFRSQVRQAFRNQPEVYDNFLNAIKEYRSKLDLPALVQRVAHLFRDHPELYLRFTATLSPEERIVADQLEQASNPCSSSGSTGTSLTPMESSLQARANSPTASPGEVKKSYLSFVDRVKHELRNHPEAVEECLAIAKELYSENCTPEILQGVSIYLRDPRRLTEAVEECLAKAKELYPENCTPEIHQRVSNLLRDPRRLTVGFEKFLLYGLTERSQTLLRMMRQEVITARELNDARSYIDKVRSEFSNQPQVFNDFLSATEELYPESENTPEILRRVSNLLRGHPELIAGYNEFLPPHYKIRVENDHEMQVDGGSSLSGATGTSLTHSQQTQQATANPPTASLSAAAAAEPPAEIRSIPKDAEEFKRGKSSKAYTPLRL